MEELLCLKEHGAQGALRPGAARPAKATQPPMAWTRGPALYTDEGWTLYNHVAVLSLREGRRWSH